MRVSRYPNTTVDYEIHLDENEMDKLCWVLAHIRDGYQLKLNPSQSRLIDRIIARGSLESD